MTAMTAAPATTEAHAAPSAPGPETSHATVLLLRQTHPSSAAAEALVRLRGELMAAGFTVHAVPTSEVRKADGSLTCQSIVFDR